MWKQKIVAQKISSNILIYCLVETRFKRKFNKLKKVKNFLIILLKLVFSDGYWMKLKTDLKEYLFCFKKRVKI